MAPTVEMNTEEKERRREGKAVTRLKDTTGVLETVLSDLVRRAGTNCVETILSSLVSRKVPLLPAIHESWMVAPMTATARAPEFDRRPPARLKPNPHVTNQAMANVSDAEGRRLGREVTEVS